MKVWIVYFGSIFFIQFKVPVLWMIFSKILLKRVIQRIHMFIGIADTTHLAPNSYHYYIDLKHEMTAYVIWLKRIHIIKVGYLRSVYEPPYSSFHPTSAHLYWRWIFPVECRSNICSCLWKVMCRRGYSGRYWPIGWSCRCWWPLPAYSILITSRLSCLIFDFGITGGSCPGAGWAWVVRLAQRLPC